VVQFARSLTTEVTKEIGKPTFAILSVLRRLGFEDCGLKLHHYPTSSKVASEEICRAIANKKGHRPRGAPPTSNSIEKFSLLLIFVE
jgi:hypothetical protein